MQQDRQHLDSNTGQLVDRIKHKFTLVECAEISKFIEVVVKRKFYIHLLRITE